MTNDLLDSIIELKIVIIGELNEQNRRKNIELLWNLPKNRNNRKKDEKNLQTKEMILKV